LQDLGHQDLPATSTVTGILHRHGLISAAQSQAAQPYVRFERAAPNQLWQMDFKGHFALRQGRCHPLCALDDHSRYNVLLAACEQEQETTVRTHLTGAFRRYGLPDALLWDNGPPWGCGGSEYTGLDVWLMRLGVRSYHGRPYHPQTQGKEERFHKSLLAEVLVRGGWSDCQHVQGALDHWRMVYNTQRPHDSLALDTPVSRYQPSQRTYPETLPPVEYSAGVEVRRVDVGGWFSYRGQDCKVGLAFASQPVGLRPTATDGVWEVLFLAQVIKELDLRQPQPPTVP
jgi:transposase InsO family protein